jgi:DnaJ like chaperone protein
VEGTGRLSLFNLIGTILDVVDAIGDELTADSRTYRPPRPPRAAQKRITYRDLSDEQLHARKALARNLCALLLEVAKADGQVTAPETAKTLSVIADRISLFPEEKRVVEVLLHDLSERPRALETAISETRAKLSDSERAQLVQGLYVVAAADGKVDRAERAAVRKISNLLGVSEAQRRSALGNALGTVALCYDVLGVSPTATEDELKAAYARRKASPDDEALTSEEIDEAYEQLRQMRGIA